MSRVLIASNRLPIAVRKREEGGFEVKRTAGGLATGLSGVHDQGEGLWIGWPGIADDSLSEDDRRALAGPFADLRVVPVPLVQAEVESYYEGFCNGIVWPLFHYLLGQLPFSMQAFELYESVNRRFADAVVQNARPGDLIWIHDYHLMLAPRMIRERLPEAKIGYFLHIPFPSSDIFRTLPWREKLLEGLLGADLVGFHTAAYLRHFASSVLRTLGAAADVDIVQWGHRRVKLGVYPMGVDVDAWIEAARKPDVKSRAAEIPTSPDEKLLVGIDRLDYTKGIPHRLLAFERLLQNHPELRGKVRFLQCAVPSRTNVEAYQHFRAEVDGLVGRIHGQFATPDWVPVHYMMRDLPFDELVALYRAADVMVVTPIRDGMNLVAKEFAATREDEDGVLVLSEFAGAASELAEAVLVNPFDVESCTTAFYRALTMPPEERKSRMRGLRRRVLSNSVRAWAKTFVDALDDRPGLRKPRVERTPERVLLEVVGRIREAEQLIMLLDYDGTMVPFAKTPALARPDAEILSLLETLGRRPRTTVHVVSGRDRQTLEAWLGHLPLWLHGEHGFWTRPAGQPGRENQPLSPLDWKDAIRRLMQDHTSRTPGSLLEEKAAGFAWHYRAAEPEFGVQQANELMVHISSMFSNAPIEILHGAKVVEVRAHGIHKGAVVPPIVEQNPGALFVAIGDDRTDEDLFAALPSGRGVSIHVGPTQSRAEYRIDDVSETRRLLTLIAQ